MIFENKDQESILEDLLNLVPENTNKEEGTLVYTTLAAMAEKMEAIYIDMEEATENTYADTADREHLIRIAAERGMTPSPATKAIYKAYFNCKIDLGDRFAPEDTEYILTVIKQEEIVNDKYYYLLETEDSGTKINDLTGELDYIEGESEEFEKGIIDSLKVAAVDEQDTEDFRREYFENAKAMPFSGNIPAYVQAITDIKGVGACKITNSNNKILATIIDDSYEAASTELIEKVQNIIDPDTDINNWGQEFGLPQLEDYKGKGYGIAPIDHDVLIQSAEIVKVDIEVYPAVLQGFTIADVQEAINKKINQYINDKKASWKNVRKIIIKKNEIIALLLDINGVDDIVMAKVNNATRIDLEYNQIPTINSIEVKI